MLNKLFHIRSKTIFSAAVILGAASLISRFLGLLRDRLLAGRFGAGDELDIYYAAFRIPDLVFSLLVLGAVSAGFIPVFVSYLKNKNKAWRLANSVLNLIILSLIIVCGVLIVFSPLLIKIIAPGFSEKKLALTVNLARVMFLSPFFLGISAVFGGVLQSFRRFLTYALAPIMYNLGIIAGIIFFVDYFGLIGLAYGVVLGAFLHMLIQIPTAIGCGFSWGFVLDLKLEGVKRIFRLMPPRILSLVISQANLWAMTLLASLLSAGSIAVYNLAFNICSFPLGVFGISFSVAAFPRLSRTAQKKELLKFIRTFFKTLQRILFFILPAMTLFIVLRIQIVEVVLGTGQFEKKDILLTAETLAYLCLSLFAGALILLYLRGFFAWEDAKTPFLLGLLSLLFRLPLAWVLSLYNGVAGLALGFSLGSIFYFFLLMFSLKKKIMKYALKEKNTDKILEKQKTAFYAVLKMIFASCLAGLTAYFSLRFLSNLDMLVGGILSGLIGVLVYLLLSYFLRLKEIKIVFKIFKYV